MKFLYYLEIAEINNIKEKIDNYARNFFKKERCSPGEGQCHEVIGNFSEFAQNKNEYEDLQFILFKEKKQKELTNILKSEEEKWKNIDRDNIIRDIMWQYVLGHSFIKYKKGMYFFDPTLEYNNNLGDKDIQAIDSYLYQIYKKFNLAEEI